MTIHRLPGHPHGVLPPKVVPYPCAGDDATHKVAIVSHEDKHEEEGNSDEEGVDTGADGLLNVGKAVAQWDGLSRSEMI